MKRGDLCWAELKPRSGSEETGRRPVVIVSSDGFNDEPSWRSIVVIPVMTSTSQALCGPSVVPLPDVGSMLNPNSVAVCHQIATLDRSKIDTRIGALTALEMAGIEEGIRAACDLP